ncbi:hypothetical protein HMPREF1982_03916 [Clostridiales bacterium oral taxon 876 str. F0540]|nr:hypothetical protein HMPREF1982_03916 [Clostridiales bacterium oral taxon 876 str. F0540]
MDINNKWEKIAFIIHKIVFGVIYYGGFIFLYKLQNSALKIKSGFVSSLVYFIPILFLIWFFDVCRKKNTWKPFGRLSDKIEILIIIITLLVLLITIGII